MHVCFDIVCVCVCVDNKVHMGRVCIVYIGVSGGVYTLTYTRYPHTNPLSRLTYGDDVDSDNNDDNEDRTDDDDAIIVQMKDNMRKLRL